MLEVDYEKSLSSLVSVILYLDEETKITRKVQIHPSL